ncbi:MAG: serine hydrolase [bacterium]|nr:serine hydrolase [bacterium]
MNKLFLINKLAVGVLMVLTVVLAVDHLNLAWDIDDRPQTYYANPFAKLNLTAKAAVLYDPEKNEIIYAKNAYQPLPLASITKLMTALVASDLVGNEAIVAVSAETLKTEGDSGLLRDEIWSLKKLIDFTLVSSSNDGAAALAAVASTGDFVNQMNKEAVTLGLTATTFTNPTGLDLTLGTGVNQGSALDVARLMSYLLKTKPELLADTGEQQISVASENNLNHIAVNTNTLVGHLPGLFASKTGFTDLAGGNLVVAVDIGLNQPVIAVVLGSTEEGRFTDIEALIATARRDNYLIKR